MHLPPTALPGAPQLYADPAAQTVAAQVFSRRRESEMSTMSESSGRSTRSITNSCSVSGYTPLSGLFCSTGLTVPSGALTANTLKTIFSATGSGLIHVLFARTTNATSRTLRMRLTIDGVVVFDSTSGSITAVSRGGVITGGNSGTEVLPVTPIVFNTSAVFEIASSLTESNTIETVYILETK